MKRFRSGLAIFAVLAVATAAAASHKQPRRQPPPPASTRPQQRPDLLALTGRVTQIHAPRLFTVQRTTDRRELLVLAPRELSPEFSGATVNVEGTLRKFTDADLSRIAGWRDIDTKIRERFRGQPVLVAASFMAIVGGEQVERIQPAPMRTPATAEPPSRLPAEVERPARPLAIRATMLADNIEAFAGQPLRVLHGRIVGVLEPRAFLIEPATSYLKPMGGRDRMLVLLESVSLRAPAELLVGSIVSVTGMARTVVGLQVTRELPWPSQLSPDVVRRLEVRGALLATSVQSGDGTELTDRPGERAR